MPFSQSSLEGSQPFSTACSGQEMEMNKGKEEEKGRGYSLVENPNALLILS
jgi:hypothetical protein